MNIREFDSRLANLEGKLKQVSIGNIRELRKIIFIELANMPEGERNKLLAKYKNK